MELEGVTVTKTPRREMRLIYHSKGSPVHEEEGCGGNEEHRVSLTTV